jgi:hypothetical protein
MFVVFSFFKNVTFFRKSEYKEEKKPFFFEEPYICIKKKCTFAKLENVVLQRR